MKFITIQTILAALVCSIALAEPGDKLLTCSNNSGSIVFDICGVRGCPATITLGGTATVYNFKRAKDSKGALTYSTRNRPRCTVVISPLKKGSRKIQNATCARSLRSSSCVFTLVTATPTPLPGTPSPTATP